MSATRTQDWNAAQYAANARFVSDLGLPVVELLAPRPGERILDLGCGDGALTIELVKLGCAVVGVDASPEMVVAAKSLGLVAEVMDGTALGFDGEFDAVFSNAALHWMREPERVVAGVWRALKPGGRFVGEFGGHGNVSAIVCAIEQALSSRGVAIANPWFFPQPEEYRHLLESRGFLVQSIELFPRPTPLPGDLAAWLEVFAQIYLAGLPEPERKGFIAEVADALRPVLRDAEGRWQADYVRLRFSASKPPSSG